ncbi:hypothetical protein Vadar_003515 [Vaccinium darrowii]|uniref:Uncharacterized protein n=1 Tax=Vaccinium darrowii TaxID=229202 RepID=A0ACB7YK46_9ERIC|nr:hypothetical protein Vadar_003515 [Vaccinium darrowii]
MSDYNASAEQTMCYCNKMGKMRTSWTDSNPGRRFIGCEKWKLTKEDSGCGFFVWYDRLMCARSKMIIPGLLRTLRRTEVEAKRAKQMEKMYKALLVGSWVLFVGVEIWYLK